MSGHLARRQITLPPGTTQVAHLLALNNPAHLMVWPLWPLGGWFGVTIGQPTLTTVPFVNGTGQEVVLNVEFFVPPEFLGVGQTDDY